jgi:hypothetical protein
MTAVVKLDRLPALATKIDGLHQAAFGAAEKAMELAAECGRCLIEAKQLVAHGKWLPWLEANTKVVPRQSQKYMRLAQHWSEIEAKCDETSHLRLGIDGALDLIAEPKPKPKLVAKPKPKPAAPQPSTLGKPTAGVTASDIAKSEGREPMRLSREAANQKGAARRDWDREWREHLVPSTVDEWRIGYARALHVAGASIDEEVRLLREEHKTLLGEIADKRRSH